MKPSIIFTGLLLLAFISCNSKRENTNKVPETPKALEEKTIYSDISYPRKGDDLLEDLYQELADVTPNLKTLDKEMNELNNSKSDSIKQFKGFNSKSYDYYNSVRSKIVVGIKDSFLKEKMRMLLENSLQKYKASTTKHTALLANIDSSEASLNDLYMALKITKTLPIIEKYQQQHLPNTKPLESYLQQQQKTIKKVEANLKK